MSEVTFVRIYAPFLKHTHTRAAPLESGARLNRLRRRADRRDHDRSIGKQGEQVCRFCRGKGHDGAAATNLRLIKISGISLRPGRQINRHNWRLAYQWTYRGRSDRLAA